MPVDYKSVHGIGVRASHRRTVGRGGVCRRSIRARMTKFDFHIGTTTGVLSRNGKNFNFVIIIGLHYMHRAEGGGVQVVGQCACIVPYLIVPVCLLTKIDCMQFLGSSPLSLSLNCSRMERERNSGSRFPGPLGMSCGPHQSY